MVSDELFVEVQSPKIKNVFNTNVIIQKCPYFEYYSTEVIISSLLHFVRQFEKETLEQTGKAFSSVTAGEQGQIGHFHFLQPLMEWIINAVWYNRHYLQGGKKANGVALGRNWINEMHRGCSGIEHQHACPVAVFYVRIPENGADMIFVNGDENIPADVREGDLLIHDRGISHSVSEHKSDISRICLILEFDFLY